MVAAEGFEEEPAEAIVDLFPLADAALEIGNLLGALFAFDGDVAGCLGDGSAVGCGLGA